MNVIRMSRSIVTRSFIVKLNFEGRNIGKVDLLLNCGLMYLKLPVLLGRETMICHVSWRDMPCLLYGKTTDQDDTNNFPAYTAIQSGIYGIIAVYFTFDEL
jgi:hypothetical protein